MDHFACRNCGGQINSVPYEDQFCSEECYIEKYRDEDAEEIKMNGVEKIWLEEADNISESSWEKLKTNPFAWSR